MALTTCTVSGTICSPDGVALSGVAVYAYTTQPLLQTDGSLISPFELITSTDSSGAWSFVLAETATVGGTVTIAFDLPTGTTTTVRRTYTIIVPATPTAAFSTLAAGQ